MRLLLVEDHPLMRLGVAGLVKKEWPDATIVESPKLEHGLLALKTDRFDLVLLDLSLPDARGLEGLVRMHRAAPDLPILILSMHDEAAYASRALQLGASGYVTKEHTTSELLAAISALRAGGRYISRTLAARLAEVLTGAEPPKAPHDRLSPQEYRVMLLIAAGRSAGEIAETMSLSVKTVGTYRSRIIEKTGLENTAAIARYCLERGLLGDH
ncbi:MAG TPA: DNA-binding response regulator [Xanthomonadaceae bacterium]|nr:DNA-binding response regulator [Xanthomonadaceae bacterium]